ncbi:hypothetical protein BDU57DRAFT_513611 [Ampelomyces quisqualis]|uniref:Uncharacterized protein n=1 Tax=Ampelomyces quisqualis TaxID=50730 RepID=A0A6A5QR83_AMPQU|nr:hypothetical protein BDU57DRAFT_513611 [Ampelomyces quisqualis]
MSIFYRRQLKELQKTECLDSVLCFTKEEAKSGITGAVTTIMSLFTIARHGNSLGWPYSYCGIDTS